MDGQLSFFEQDHASFTRQLKNCMLPGPIAYCKKTDCIITASSELRIEAYKYVQRRMLALGAPHTPLLTSLCVPLCRYQILAAASQSRPKPGARAGAGAGAGGRPGFEGKVIKTDWTLNVGERIQELRIAPYSRSLATGQVDILAIGEHTLFAVSESGAIHMQKRVDYNPACATAYFRGRAEVGAGTHNMMVSSHASQLMVYNDVTLVWAAVLQAVPVAMEVAEFDGLRGLLVALDETGTVRVTYMGTDPPTSGVSSGDAKELNYEEMDEEHRRLLTQVKESHSEHRPEPDDKVLLRVQVPSVLDAPEGENQEESKLSSSMNSNQPAQLTVRLFVSYTGRDVVNAVNVSLCVPDTVTARETSFVLESLGTSMHCDAVPPAAALRLTWFWLSSYGWRLRCTEGGRTPAIIPLVFTANGNVMPGELDVKVAAAYLTNSGEPRTAQITVRLPLCITCRLVAPLKNNTFKVRWVFEVVGCTVVCLRVCVSVSVSACLCVCVSVSVVV